MNQVKVQTRPVPVGIAVAVAVLTLFTAGCHLYLGVSGLAQPGIGVLATLFLLNGLGYLALLAALMLPIPQLSGYRHWLRWGLLGFAVVTVVVWVVLEIPVNFKAIPLAYMTKVDELVLIGLLWLGGGVFNR